MLSHAHLLVIMPVLMPTCKACIYKQVVMYELLDTWGRNGLITHVKKMQTDYKNRAAIVQEAAGGLVISVQMLGYLCLYDTEHIIEQPT